MNKKQKMRRDRRTIMLYGQKLQARRKEYGKQAEAFALGGQRNRAAALGACCLQVMDEVRKLKATKHLLDGSLFYGIGEQRVKDTDGKKGYRYIVAYHAYADEQAISDEEIQAEIEDLQKKLDAETAEMFGLEMQAEEEVGEVKDTSIQ